MLRFGVQIFCIIQSHAPLTGSIVYTLLPRLLHVHIELPSYISFRSPPTSCKNLRISSFGLDIAVHRGVQTTHRTDKRRNSGKEEKEGGGCAEA